METIEIMTKAIKQSELDCCMWDEDICRKLATEVLIALQKAGYQLYEYNPK